VQLKLPSLLAITQNLGVVLITKLNVLAQITKVAQNFQLVKTFQKFSAEDLPRCVVLINIKLGWPIIVENRVMFACSGKSCKFCV